MAQQSFDRRDFHKLTTAALGGLAAGAVLGCGKEGEKVKGGDGGVTQVATTEGHLCRGLNECKGQGNDSKNSCRGQGACATAKEHSCGGQNDCKGLGGCGETVGANDCKGKGGCHVPLMTDPPGESAWDKLRKKKEAEWGEKKLEVGPAPPKAA
jgi:hypothetical protein